MTLNDFYKENPHAALAFSGGVDSSFLMGAAAHAGADIHAYMVKSAFQPEFELREACELAEQLNVPLTVIDVDVLGNAEIAANPENRCYFCKRALFGALIEAARTDGFDLILDGTNASDDAGDRPGMKVLTEYGVCSPLRECGMTKADVRSGAKELGLKCWDKPAYSCLATRVQTGMKLTADILEKVEAAETALFDLGYSDFRVRIRDNDEKIYALCQFPSDQLSKALEQSDTILKAVGQYIPDVRLDETAR